MDPRLGAVADSCTLFAEGWWQACCVEHDAGYAAQILRLLADDSLLDCVVHSLPAVAIGHPVLTALFTGVSAAVGGVMWIGVRVFGGWFYRRAKAERPPG